MSTDIPILLYHSVSPNPPAELAPWSVPPQLFAEHMQALVDAQCQVLNVGQLVSKIRRGEPISANTVVLSFDDGLRDFAENSWPVLRSHRLSATHYVVAGCIGQTSRWLSGGAASGLPMLSAAQLRELAQEGLDIGSHSMHHPQLDAIPRSQASQEIFLSKQVLENILGSEVTGFAYPHGYHDSTIRQMVIDAGYAHAAAVRNALSHPQDDLYAMARYTVMNNCSTQQLLEVLSGRGVPRANDRELLQTKVWRTFRRVRALIEEH